MRILYNICKKGRKMLRINAARQFINLIPSYCNTTVKKIYLATTTLFARCIDLGLLLKKYTTAQKTSPASPPPASPPADNALQIHLKENKISQINARRFINFIPPYCNTTVKKICLATTLVAGYIGVGLLLKKYITTRNTSPASSPADNAKQIPQGFLDFENGNGYVGEIKDQKPEGRGKLIRQDGYVYQGSFVNGKAEGFGTLFSPNGEPYYKGKFKNGLAHGQGYTFLPGGKKYLTDFQEGEPVTPINWIPKEDGLYVFSSSLDEHGRITGVATCFYSNEERYDGEFRRDQKHGKGILVRPNGVQYNGRFFNNQKHGTGTFIFPDGSKYTCQHDRDRLLSCVQEP